LFFFVLLLFWLVHLAYVFLLLCLAASSAADG
jgi:hypothetical protein